MQVFEGGGRLGKSKLIPFENRHPLILPNSDNEFVASLIRYHRQKNYHCSALESFYLIGQQFYIIDGA